MKRLWLGFLVIVLVLPASVFAARTQTQPTTEELLEKINQLSNELEALKGQLKEVKARQTKIKSRQEDTADTLDEVSDKVDDVLTNGVDRCEL